MNLDLANTRGAARWVSYAHSMVDGWTDKAAARPARRGARNAKRINYKRGFDSKLFILLHCGIIYRIVPNKLIIQLHFKLKRQIVFLPAYKIYFQVQAL